MKFDKSIVQTTLHSPLGSMTIAATDKGLAGLWFEGQRHLPKALTAPRPALGDASRRTLSGAAVWPVNARHPVLKQVSQQLEEYFAGQRDHFDVPLDLSGGTDFQQSVWRVLLAIPPGRTASYSDVSRRIGKPAAVRAVGAAVGRNPVSIIVPCHRVIGMNGALTGYAGGLDRKTALLKLEGALEDNLL